VEIGFALALLGHLDDTAQLLDYLAARQSPDGRWGQNFAAAADHGYDRGASYCTGWPRLAGRAGSCPSYRGSSSPTAWRSAAALTLAIERLDDELHQFAKADPRVKALRTLSGAGEFTALVMVAEIGDISRFGSARELAARAGRTPTVQGSDLKVRHGAHLQAGPGVAAVGDEPGRAGRMPPLMAADRKIT
jgi:Transposase IS116/IS110/IS902 family